MSHSERPEIAHRKKLSYAVKSLHAASSQRGSTVIDLCPHSRNGVEMSIRAHETQTHQTIKCANVVWSDWVSSVILPFPVAAVGTA